MTTNGVWLDRESWDSFLDYYKIAQNYYRTIRDSFISEWDGYDYYDGEYIKDNFNLDFNHTDYPTIDHKVSIKMGFKLGIPPRDISNFDNLCITKKVLNSKKGYKTEEDYIKQKIQS